MRTSTYHSWAGMKNRCRNSSHVRYGNYGGKGVTYCISWETFEGFLADMGERPEGKTLERLNNSLGYSKTNCVWATPQEQALNHSRRKDNSSGITGVGSLRGKWQAYAQLQGVQIHLYFGDDFFEACCARKSWEAKNIQRKL